MGQRSAGSDMHRRSGDLYQAAAMSAADAAHVRGVPVSSTRSCFAMGADQEEAVYRTASKQERLALTC